MGVPVGTYGGVNLGGITSWNIALSPLVSPPSLEVSEKAVQFYRDVADDLKNGKPLVAVVHLVLWDNGFGEDVGVYGNGNDPDKNLYWGAKYGAYTLFRQHPDWTLVREEVNVPDLSKRVIFRRTVHPDGVLKREGVSAPFPLYVVFNVYTASQIAKAYENLGKAFGPPSDPINFQDGSTNVVLRESDGQLLGYSGHVDSMAANNMVDMLSIQAKVGGTDRKTKGIFLFSCYSDGVLRNMKSDRVYGFAFTNDKIAPEGYLLLSLFESVGEGRTPRQVIQGLHQTNIYYHSQTGYPLPAENLFLNEDDFLSRSNY